MHQKDWITDLPRRIEALRQQLEANKHVVIERWEVGDPIAPAALEQLVEDANAEREEAEENAISFPTELARLVFATNGLSLRFKVAGPDDPILCRIELASAAQLCAGATDGIVEEQVSWPVFSATHGDAVFVDESGVLFLDDDAYAKIDDFITLEEAVNQLFVCFGAPGWELSKWDDTEHHEDDARQLAVDLKQLRLVIEGKVSSPLLG